MVYSLERAIIEQVRKDTAAELCKLIPRIRHYDYQFIGFCIVQTLLNVYKEAGVGQTADENRQSRAQIQFGRNE